MFSWSPPCAVIGDLAHVIELVEDTNHCSIVFGEVDTRRLVAAVAAGEA